MSQIAPRGIRGWCFLCQVWHPGEQYTPERVIPRRPSDLVERLDHLWRAYSADFIAKQRASELGFNLVLSSLVSLGIDPDIDEKIWMYEIIAFAREMYKDDEREAKQRADTNRTQGPTVDGGSDGDHEGGESLGVPEDGRGDG